MSAPITPSPVPDLSEISVRSVPEPRITKIATNHLSAADARFIVAIFDAPRLRHDALTLDQRLKFHGLIDALFKEQDGKTLTALMSLWDGLTSEQRDGLYADALQSTLANRARTRAGRPALRIVSRGRPAAVDATTPRGPEAA